MVATVGSISIDLSTNTVKFAEGFKRAATTVERESGRMSKAVSGFSTASAGMLKGFGGGFVGGIVGALGIGTLESALGKVNQALHKFEDIGISAKASGLNVEFFQGLQFAAHETDVATETLNSSLEIFARNMGLAREGAGGLYSGLLKLNPALLQMLLGAKDQEERLKLVADAMKALPDAAQKAALATAVFGRSGADMVRLLEGGAEVINKFEAEAKRLGLVFTEADVKRWADAADRIDRLGFVWQTKFAGALAASAPAIEATIEHLANFHAEIGKLGGSMDAFVKRPSFATFMKMMLGKGFSIEENSIADAARDWITGAESATEAQDRLQIEIRETHELLSQQFKVGIDTTEALQKLNRLKAEAAALGATVRDMDLAQRFRAAENASMRALTGGGGSGSRMTVVPGLPNVQRGIAAGTIPGIDKDVTDKIQAALDEEAGITREVAARTRDVYGATRDVYDRIDRLDTNIGGYIGGLSDGLDHSFAAISTDLGILTRSYRDAMRLNAEGFGFSGAGGSSGSWAGRQYKLDAAPFTVPLGGGTQAPLDTQQQPIVTSTDTGAGGATNINLNYTAAPGDSEATSRQNARVMLSYMQHELARS